VGKWNEGEAEGASLYFEPLFSPMPVAPFFPRWQGVLERVDAGMEGMEMLLDFLVTVGDELPVIAVRLQGLTKCEQMLPYRR